MASTLHLLFLSLSSYFLSLGHAQISHSNFWVLSVAKDPATLQYLTHTRIGGSPEPVGLVVDLGGPSIWLNCSSSFSSRPIGSCSIECLTAYGSSACSHGGSTACNLSLENSITRSTATGELAEASLAVGSATNVLISCAPKYLLRGLASGARGMLGLGNTRIALPSQLAGHRRRFALCLSSNDHGLLISGHGHDLLPITKSLTYTPLVEVPQQQGYLVKVNHIKIKGKRVSLGKRVPLNAKISTTEPYSKMESSVFSTFVEAFAIAGANMSRVAAVEPFELCYASSGGAVAPEIDLVLQSEMVKWRVEGMVRVSEEVVCLGFVDGGAEMEVPMVVGGHQLEDVWLQFDLASSMLGFSSSLLTRKTSCSMLASEIEWVSKQSL